MARRVFFRRSCTSRHRRGGMTLVEVVISMGIMLVMMLGLAAAILETARQEILSRETVTVRLGLAQELQNCYGQSSATLLSWNGKDFALTNPNNESISPKPGDPDGFIGKLLTTEVDPSTLLPSPGSGFFQCLGVADWRGMAGEHSVTVECFVNGI